MNRVELIGGVAEAPIQRVTRNGGDYVTFNMITNAEFRRQGWFYWFIFSNVFGEVWFDEASICA